MFGKIPFPPSQSADADSSPKGRAYVKVSDKIPLFARRKATAILHFAFCIFFSLFFITKNKQNKSPERKIYHEQVS